MLQIGSKLIPGAELFIQTEEQVLVSVDHLPTMPAYQMDVGTMLVGSVDYPALSKIDTTGKSLRHQQVEGAVNCGDIRRGCFALDVGKNFLSVNMISAVNDRLDDNLALMGDAEALGAQSLEK